MSEPIYTQAQLELAVKEAASFAYEQGKNETLVNVLDYLQSLALHPVKPELSTVVKLVRGGFVD